MWNFTLESIENSLSDMSAIQSASNEPEVPESYGNPEDAHIREVPLKPRDKSHRKFARDVAPASKKGLGKPLSEILLALSIVIAAMVMAFVGVSKFFFPDSLSEANIRELISQEVNKQVTSKSFSDVYRPMSKTLDNAKSSEPTVSLDPIRAAVAAEADVMFSDRTGIPDYAAYSAGGRVVRHSLVYDHEGDDEGSLSLRSLLAKLKHYFSRVTHKLKFLRTGGVHPNANEWLLTSGFLQPGRCLPLSGSTGSIDIRIRQQIHPVAVTLEHIPYAMSFDYGSAPREFEIHGWDSKNGTVIALGVFEWSTQERQLQKFMLNTTSHTLVDHIRLNLWSNYGHPKYTCLYRLRVHGNASAAYASPDPTAWEMLELLLQLTALTFTLACWVYLCFFSEKWERGVGFTLMLGYAFLG